ncbi:MAG TPA: hypothetical protein VKQ34_04825 [Candidatus Saccharimonadales bacterium]|nr:hypothetical protein [Candidatus Saccharimonadales bacterium]
MKRTIGTTVLFILLVLTITALTQLNGTAAASNQVASTKEMSL